MRSPEGVVLCPFRETLTVRHRPPIAIEAAWSHYDVRHTLLNDLSLLHILPTYVWCALSRQPLGFWIKKTVKLWSICWIFLMHEANLSVYTKARWRDEFKSACIFCASHCAMCLFGKPHGSLTVKAKTREVPPCSPLHSLWAVDRKAPWSQNISIFTVPACTLQEK